MNKIGIFSFGRMQSERCPNKMLRPFAETTLTDIVLSKLAHFGENSFFAGYESQFEHKCQQHNVPFVKRDENSINIDGPITDILSFLKDLDYDHFLIVSGCLPFLQTKTIENFLEQCIRAQYQPSFSVLKVNNFMLDEAKNPINFDASLKTINTKTVKPVYEFAHALYFFNKEYFFENKRYWNWSDVNYIELMNKKELLDIDTEEDFLIIENLWKFNSAKG